MISLKAMTIIVAATSMIIAKSVATMPLHCSYMVKKEELNTTKGKRQ
jgi:hypothetical protein